MTLQTARDWYSNTGQRLRDPTLRSDSFPDVLSRPACSSERSDVSIRTTLDFFRAEAGLCHRPPMGNGLEQLLTFQHPVALNASAEYSAERHIETIDSITNDPGAILRDHDVRRNTSRHG